ncbi:hypothetical protein KTT_34380 [Tengunoibacter tsumagoiensis]|uniref:Uncharacterized protein n=1 Tax=Tengunoibacter tsumagoiensis TaxID=2014871 RepID=A0A402A3G1_9CHLR|nr:hypothetical protein KTT_34380 [Tengunoibacter tsumagoiensis]
MLFENMNRPEKPVYAFTSSHGMAVFVYCRTRQGSAVKFAFFVANQYHYLYNMTFSLANSPLFLYLFLLAISGIILIGMVVLACPDY